MHAAKAWLGLSLRKRRYASLDFSWGGGKGAAESHHVAFWPGTHYVNQFGSSRHLSTCLFLLSTEIEGMHHHAWCQFDFKQSAPREKKMLDRAFLIYLQD